MTAADVCDQIMDTCALFDQNLFAVQPGGFTIRLAPPLRNSTYEELQGRALHLPQLSALRPSPRALRKRWAVFATSWQLG